MSKENKNTEENILKPSEIEECYGGVNHFDSVLTGDTLNIVSWYDNENSYT